ncbi:MAG: hypothetical protein V3R66_01140 [Rhodospirillales bacterium]
MDNMVMLGGVVAVLGAMILLVSWGMSGGKDDDDEYEDEEE